MGNVKIEELVADLAALQNMLEELDLDPVEKGAITSKIDQIFSDLAINNIESISDLNNSSKGL